MHKYNRGKGQVAITNRLLNMWCDDSGAGRNEWYNRELLNN